MQVQNAWPKFQHLGSLNRPSIANHRQQFQENKGDQVADEEEESTDGHDVSDEDAENEEEEEENDNDVDDGTKTETRNNTSHLMHSLSSSINKTDADLDISKIEPIIQCLQKE